jgi:signal peptidase II
MFYARFINFPVFNVADSCITIASILLIVVWWMESQKPSIKPDPADSPVS